MFKNFNCFTGFLWAQIGIFIKFSHPYQKSIINPLCPSIIAVHFVLGLILWPLKNLIVAARAPKISLGQKYLTTSTLYDPSYNTLDLHRDLKKLTGSSVILLCQNDDPKLSNKRSLIYTGIAAREIKEEQKHIWLIFEAKWPHTKRLLHRTHAHNHLWEKEPEYYY